MRAFPFVILFFHRSTNVPRVAARDKHSGRESHFTIDRASLMSDDWQYLPAELLHLIFKLLSFEELLNCSYVCYNWRRSVLADRLWKRLLEKDFSWIGHDSLATANFISECIYFNNHVPKVKTEVIDDFEYDITLCCYSKYGKYFAICGEDAHFCIYRSKPLEFIHERTLVETLRWKKIVHAEFSPDEEKILLNGTKQDGSGEVAIFLIQPDTGEVHFASRVPSNPPSFRATWYDSFHIIVSEIHFFSPETPIGTSVSQLWLSSIDRNSSKTLLVPFLRFLNRRGIIWNPIFVDVVSPRFRRIIQMSEEAKADGVTLRQKLSELSLTANIDDENVDELKEILDKKNECYRCYLEHFETVPKDCSCMCHQDNRKLLIYVSEDFSQRLCFKMISQKLITDALTMTTFSNRSSTQSEPEEDPIEQIMNQFDKPDYHIDFHGAIQALSLSPDQKTLTMSMIRIDEIDACPIKDIKVVDVEKMVVNSIRSKKTDTCFQKHSVSSNNFLLSSLRDNRIDLWSRHHRGFPVRTIELENNDILCTALHPIDNIILIVSSRCVSIYKPS